jgi:metallo-beta-lactamase class B
MRLICYKIIYVFLLIVSLSYAGLSRAESADAIKPFPPFRIIGNLYYVGTDYQGNYLIVTPKGNILINSDYKSDVPLIKASIEKLGFKFSDTKILLISHAHADHAGGSALIKKLTGAKYEVMDADVPVVESGGKADFQYSDDPEQLYKPVKVDRVLHDGDEVKLGGTVLVAHLTGGHTKGCTTWTMQVTEKGKTYHVVIVGGTAVNPGFQLIHNTAYPNIAKDYEHTFNVLKSLPCDIFLGAHGMYYDLEKKYALMMNGKANAFVDPEGYKKYVAKAEQDFHKELLKQQETVNS